VVKDTRSRPCDRVAATQSSTIITERVDRIRVAIVLVVLKGSVPKIV